MPRERPSYLRLCPGEPFRIFFPLATLLGISGVSLWPLYFSGLHKFYPGIMHARLMIEGFVAGFALGFLGTALPRLLAAPPLRRGEVWPLVATYLLTAGLHIGHQTRAGDLAFVALLLGFGACMIARFRRRADLPPPGFVLVAFGYLAGLCGPVLWLAGMQGWAPAQAAMFGVILLHQGFALFLLLGVAMFLVPRFLGIAETPLAPVIWRLRAKFAAMTAVALLISFWIEAGNPVSPIATTIRVLAVFIYLAAAVPFHRQARPVRTIALSAQLALFALLAGLVFPLLWPGQRVAGLHVVFLGGFSLMVFAVATRVILGHSGNSAQFSSRLPALQIATALLLAGTLLRALGDFLIARPQWLNHASYLWMLAAAIWGFSILPKVRIADLAEGDEGASPS